MNDSSIAPEVSPGERARPLGGLASRGLSSGAPVDPAPPLILAPEQETSATRDEGDAAVAVAAMPRKCERASLSRMTAGANACWPSGRPNDKRLENSRERVQPSSRPIGE